ncbi:MAG TPA: hypothetical protein VF870_01735, partial [Ignavibacteriaceae bacterium]
MKKNKLVIPFFVVVLLLQVVTLAQYAPRQDAVWARTVPAGTITLDGILNEAAWSQAESFEINYGQDGPLPTSGWRAEFQPDTVTDPTHATVKFLVSSDNQLWLAFDIPDSSVGGNKDWARWDGILASIRSLGADNMAYAAEFFYTYWTAGRQFPDSVKVDGGPYFVSGNTNNAFATWGVDDRTPEQIANWDAKTVIVGGHSNDAGRDEGWVVEMRFNLAALGYDVT